MRLGETLIFLGIPKNPIYLSGESVEEYLEAIYKINEEGRPAKNSELTKNLKVSPPSVTQMVQKLSDEGLVVYEPYKGIYLTGKGASLAQKVVRRHRLLEVFLHDVLKLPREKVHDQACRLEHALNEETTQALCSFLGNPDKCVDGKEIPHCGLEVESCEDCEPQRVGGLRTELSRLRPGEQGRVVGVKGGRRSSKRIQDMGLTPGTVVKVVNAAPFNGPVELEIRGTKLALGRGLASHVIVELEGSEEDYNRPFTRGPVHR